jgi:hypothetical protein
MGYGAIAAAIGGEALLAPNPPYEAGSNLGRGRDLGLGLAAAQEIAGDVG